MFIAPEGHLGRYEILAAIWAAALRGFVNIRGEIIGNAGK